MDHSTICPLALPNIVVQSEHLTSVASPWLQKLGFYLYAILGRPVSWSSQRNKRKFESPCSLGAFLVNTLVARAVREPIDSATNFLLCFLAYDIPSPLDVQIRHAVNVALPAIAVFIFPLRKHR